MAGPGAGTIHGGSAPAQTPRAKEFSKYKLVFVGDVEVGKTSVIGRYVYGVFNETYQNTIGIDFLSKSLRLEDRQIRLQLWDTAGQERFRSLIPSYLRDASAVMIVYDITNRSTFANTAAWIQHVREQQGEGGTMVLVGNKADLADKRQITTQEGEEKAKQAGMMFFEVSAKTGDNIEELFRKLVAALPVQAGRSDGASEYASERTHGTHKLSARPAEVDKKCAC